MNDDKRKKCPRTTVLLTGLLLLFCLLYPSLVCLNWFYLAPLNNLPKQEEAWPSWSPDSRRLVYECYRTGPSEGGSRWSFGESEGYYQRSYTEEAADLCISGPDEPKEVRITEEQGGDWRPVWSPDGSQIAYLRQDGIYLVSPSTRVSRRLVSVNISNLTWAPLATLESGDGVSLSWSPDGNLLLFSGCIEHHDHDIYLLDIETGGVTNLTPGSRAHDFSPMWMSSGTKIIFLSADSSSQYGCRPGKDAIPTIKSINVDGNNESVIYDPIFYYVYWMIWASHDGRIGFITDMASKSPEDFFRLFNESENLYELYYEKTPVVIRLVDDLDSKSENFKCPAWSYDGKLLAYISYGDLKVWNEVTGNLNEVTENLIDLRRDPSSDFDVENVFWSPDSQKLAVNVSKLEDMAIHVEHHIYVFDLQSETFEPLLQEQSTP